METVGDYVQVQGRSSSIIWSAIQQYQDLNNTLNLLLPPVSNQIILFSFYSQGSNGACALKTVTIEYLL